MKRLRGAKLPFFVSISIAFIAVALMTVAATAQTRVGIGYALSPTSHYGVGAEAFAAAVAEATDGRYVVEQFPNSALGGEREMIEGAQIGSVDVLITSTGPVGNFVPETLITDIPFLFRDYDHARAVLDGPIGQEILARFPQHGLVALAWAENGFRNLTNSVHPVRAPADLSGLKLRTMQNDVHILAFETLGALPTPMAWPEVYTALQQGTVDGQENPIPVIVAANLADVQPYLSLTRHVYSPALFIMSKSVWDGLSETDQQAFVEAARIGAAAVREEVSRVEQSGVAALRGQGMDVVEGIDLAPFQEVLEPAYAQYAERFGDAAIARIRDYRP